MMRSRNKTRHHHNRKTTRQSFLHKKYANNEERLSSSRHQSFLHKQNTREDQKRILSDLILSDLYHCWLLKAIRSEDLCQNYYELLRYGSAIMHQPWNNKHIILSAVQIEGGFLRFASPDLQNDKQVVMTAVQNYDATRSIYQNPPPLEGMYHNPPLGFASPELRNDKEVVMVAVQNDRTGMTLQYASPSLQNDKQVVMTAIHNSKDHSPLGFASPELRNDKEVVMASVQKNGKALYFASPSLQNDKEVVMAAVEKYPDTIKYAHEDQKRDQDVLIASGMYDEDHRDAVARQLSSTTNAYRKIVLSTRFALNPTSESEATNLTALFKESKFYQEGNFILYAPNANNKKDCCDTTSCRGTKDTCQYKNVLTDDGRPTDDCCWLYSYRSQLQEAKKTGGFMLQLVETGEHHSRVMDATLGMGQRIELKMAKEMGVKVFQVYRPGFYGYQYEFEDRHIDLITEKIAQWYESQCQDMSVTIIRQKSFKHMPCVNQLNWLN